MISRTRNFVAAHLGAAALASTPMGWAQAPAPAGQSAAATRSAGGAPNAAGAASADIERVRANTAKLIGMLTDQGVLSADRADGLMKEIEATPMLVPPPVPAPRPAPSAATSPAPATAARAAGAAPAAAAAAPATPATVRVSYLPEFVRQELKEELRNEIAAQGIREGWAGPGAVPAWVRGVQLEGDLRTRLQVDRYASGNAAALNVQETNRTRSVTLLNTTEDRQRLRVRARLGLTATTDDNWSGGVRLTTGSTTDPLSSNQTLGNYNNRYTAAFDRAYIRYSSGDQFNAVFGRFGNPWFSTDLMWANDLSFDGVALQWTPTLGGRRAFLTMAAVPVQEVELSTDKWLFGVQAGLDLGSGVVRGKLGLAYYGYSHIVGKANTAGSSLNDSTAPAFAQKGNTYFNISSDPTKPLLALAADYRIVDLTGAMTVETVGGKALMLTGDFARNVGFDRAAASARLGRAVEAQTNAYLVRLAFGNADVHKRNDWQAYFGYKRVERDAVLDAFTDSDLRLGGTNTKGFVLGASYGLGRNSTASLRWLSGDAISTDAVSGGPLSVDVLHVDLSLRF